MFWKNRIANNAAWIIGCKLAQSLLNLIVGVLSARYLGPSGYGLINYAASIVAFFVPIMRLGLHATLVQEITMDPNQEGRKLGTALGLNVIASILCIIAVMLFVFATNKGDHAAIIVCAIYSLSLLFQATEMINYWFQAKLMSKYPAMAMLISYVIVSAYKIFLLVTARSIYWFAVINVLDHCIISVILIWVYQRKKQQPLGFSGNLTGKLLSKSKYYILSSMMIVIFQQTDKLMIKSMLDTTATGYYAAAVTCAGIFGFVYAAIIDSARPEILKLYRSSSIKYENFISALYCVIFYLSLGQCVVMTVFAKPIIGILYGAEFLPSVAALRVCVWYVTYAYFGSIRNIWILCKEKHRLILIIDITGAIVNVGLNFFLIPYWGICGAAVASVATQFFSNFVLGFIFKPIRENNRLLLRGLNPKCLLQIRSFL